MAEAPAPTGTPVLELRDIRKRFGALDALGGVDFEVYPREVVALVGDNGAGKSTLVKVMAGSHPPDSGEVLFDGEPAQLQTPQDAVSLGIATVYQDLALCDNLSVVSNLFLGQERWATKPLPVPPRLDEFGMEQQAVELLASLSVRLPSARSEVAALSGGQRQSVAIARALLGEPKLVLLDEPTAALGVSQTRQVLDLVVRLRERGLGVVLISHNLADVFEVADRIIVLRLGRRVATFDVASSSREEVVGAITGATEAPSTGGSGR